MNPIGCEDITWAELSDGDRFVMGFEFPDRMVVYPRDERTPFPTPSIVGPAGSIPTLGRRRRLLSLPDGRSFTAEFPDDERVVRYLYEGA